VYADQIGAPRLVTNTSNQAVWRWDQADPFGIAAPDQNPSGLGTFAYNLRLPGQYFDAETNLHYNYFRDYDPGIGRYVQSDPIGLKGGINSYLYVRASPSMWRDRRGLDATASLNGSVITINCPVSIGGDPGLVTPDLAARWQTAVNSIWNQGNWRYGRCSVRVQCSFSTDPGGLNIVTVVEPGTPHPKGPDYNNSSTVTGSNSGFWYWGAGSNDPWVVAHEVGHFFDLGDLRPPYQPTTTNNIMGPYGAPVDQSNIDSVVRRWLPNNQRRQCEC
jgi:RHS repeat-associated protein